MSRRDEQPIKQEVITEVTKPEFSTSTEMNIHIRAMNYAMDEEDEAMTKYLGAICIGVMVMFIGFGAAMILTILAALVG